MLLQFTPYSEVGKPEEELTVHFRATRDENDGKIIIALLRDEWSIFDDGSDIIVIKEKGNAETIQA